MTRSGLWLEGCGLQRTGAGVETKGAGRPHSGDDRFKAFTVAMAAASFWGLQGRPEDNERLGQERSGQRKHSLKNILLQFYVGACRRAVPFAVTPPSAADHQSLLAAIPASDDG